MSITNRRATTTQDKVWWYLFKRLIKSFSPHSFSWLILRITCKFILQGQKKTQHCQIVHAAQVQPHNKKNPLCFASISANTWIICRIYLEDHTQRKGFRVPFSTKQAQCWLDRPNLPFFVVFFPPQPSPAHRCTCKGKKCDQIKASGFQWGPRSIGRLCEPYSPTHLTIQQHQRTEPRIVLSWQR